jgi:hypothetical protein
MRSPPRSWTTVAAPRHWTPAPFAAILDADRRTATLDTRPLAAILDADRRTATLDTRPLAAILDADRRTATLDTRPLATILDADCRTATLDTRPLAAILDADCRPGGNQHPRFTRANGPWTINRAWTSTSIQDSAGRQTASKIHGRQVDLGRSYTPGTPQDVGQSSKIAGERQQASKIPLEQEIGVQDRVSDQKREETGHGQISTPPGQDARSQGTSESSLASHDTGGPEPGESRPRRANAGTSQDAAEPRRGRAKTWASQDAGDDPGEPRNGPVRTRARLDAGGSRRGWVTMGLGRRGERASPREGRPA